MIPLETAKKTFNCTTQLAMNIGRRFPFKRHTKARAPQLNSPYLEEIFSTDTFFGSKKSWGGVNCSQLFSGNKSLYADVYGMTFETQGP